MYIYIYIYIRMYICIYIYIRILWYIAGLHAEVRWRSPGSLSLVLVLVIQHMVQQQQVAAATVIARFTCLSRSVGLSITLRQSLSWSGI